MKLKDLRRIYQVIEYTLSSEKENDINFIKNDMKKVLVNYALKNTQSETTEQKKHIVNLVEHLIDEYVNTIKFHNNKTDTLNKLVDDNFNLKDITPKEIAIIPIVENKLNNVHKKYKEMPQEFNSTYEDIILNLSKSQAFSIGGAVFDTCQVEDSGYSNNFNFNGSTLIASCKNGIKPDTLVMRDGLLFICFEEIAYTINPDVMPNEVDLLLKSYNHDKEISESYKEELADFNQYRDAQRVTGIMIDEICTLFGEKYRNQLNDNSESLAMLALTSLEMEIVFGRRKHINRFQKGFQGIPHDIQETMKEAYMEIIKHESHMQTYINESTQFLRRHSFNFSFENASKIFTQKVETGLELYNSGNKKDFDAYISQIDPFIRAAINIEIKLNKQQSNDANLDQ